MRTGSTVVRVAPTRDGGWDVREPGGRRVLARDSEKTSAVLRARSMLSNGGVVQVLDVDGFLVETQTVPGPADRPWWYAAPQPFLRAIPVLLLLQAVLGVVNHRDGGFGLWSYLVVGLVGAFGVVLVISSYRRDRRLSRLPD